jgi:hypothetical protein
MAYVIAEPCIETKDTACQDASPGNLRIALRFFQVFHRDHGFRGKLMRQRRGDDA